MAKVFGPTPGIEEREYIGDYNSKSPHYPLFEERGETVIKLFVKYVCPEESRTQAGNLKYLKDLRLMAKINRNHPTEAESKLWKELKKLDYPFLRQKPVYRFILDFYCSKMLLDIEVDGDSHDGRYYYDKGRDEILARIGIKTIRFTNDRVLNDMSGIINEIKSLFCQRGI